MNQKLFELIEQFEVITLFHHVNPDGDALGSQFGLLSWLKEQYPNKEIYALGDDISSLMHLFPKHDVVSDDKVETSLAIILDTSTKERINDKRALKAKITFRVDHHLNVEHFTDFEIVKPEVSSTCQLLAMLLKEHTGKILSKTVSQYLYYGMITDTVSFSIASVTADTLNTAAYLVESGIDVSLIARNLFTVSKELYRFRTYVTEHVEFNENIAYIKLKQEDIKLFNVSSNEAKECITLLNFIEGINIWCLFIEDEKESNIYNVSLRSYRIPINETAANYGGGGHQFASGIKGLNEDQLNALLNDLANISKKS